MKNKLFLIALIPIFSFAQNEVSPCKTLSKINAIIQELHYKPKPVNDSLSVYLFKSFLKELDNDNNLFIESEIAVLKNHRLKIDDYILNENCNFLEDFYTTYNKAVDRYSKLITTIKNEPFPYSSNEFVHFSKETSPYRKDIKELQHYYKKRILFNVLREVAESGENVDSLNAHFNSLASQAKNKEFEIFECKTESLRLSKKDFYSKFYIAFCNYFDPHTTYFSSSEKSSFLSAVSAENLTFGLDFSLTKKNELSVQEVIPGSSAYFSEKIEKGDVLLKIKYKNEEYNIACSSLEKISEIISSKDYKIAEFTFKKKSGGTYDISLQKKLMKDYQNNVYSYLIKNNNIKAGYIKIPSFYAAFEGGKSNVSDDVAKEIYKLQENKINGLIIDLENNGGGSMDEAIKLTGQFIDIGPVAIMCDKNGKTRPLKDMNRGMIYSGPVLVLINGFSASASEFFTNAMQDYNRAIVIGNQSHGKASMQRILPLTDDQNPTEFIKLTLEKFYRVSGKSSQTIGITPDVFIPTLFDKQMPRESSNPTALKNDQINKTFNYNILTNSYSSFIEMSKKRISENKSAQSINDLNARINALYDNSFPPIQLQFSKVFERINKTNSIWKDVKMISETEYPITIERNSFDIENQKFDEYLKTIDKEKVKAIKSNIHIVEAVNIINDLTNKP